MSKYTTELRFICEDLSGLDESKGYNDVDDIIEEARPKIFSFNYPIFDVNYKPALETKILRHFYTREICCETYGRWKLFLEAKMNEIMPYFNQLYASELLEFQPLYDADYYREGTNEGTETGQTTGTSSRTSTDSGSDAVTKTNTETSTDSGTDSVARTNNETNTASGRDIISRTGTDTSTLSGSDVISTEGTRQEDSESHDRDVYSEWNLYSDTPQGGIAGISGAEDPPSLADNGYLTNARHIIHDGDGTERDGSATTTTDQDETTTYGRVDTRQLNTSDTTQHGKVNTISGNDSETITHGKVNNLQGSGSETINFGKINNTSGTTGGTSRSDTSEEFTHHIYGRLGGRTGAELLLEYRKTFLNIDMEVISALEPLFFQLW